jgi:hypothetical protein
MTPTPTLLPPKQVLRLHRGIDFSLLFTLTTPQDVTGWAVTFEWVLRPGNVSVFTRTVGAGVVLVPPTATSNQIRVDVPKAALATAVPSAELPAGNFYEWGLKRTDAGAAKDLAWGSGFLVREITP